MKNLRLHALLNSRCKGFRWIEHNIKSVCTFTLQAVPRAAETTTGKGIVRQGARKPLEKLTGTPKTFSKGLNKIGFGAHAH